MLIQIWIKLSHPRDGNVPPKYSGVFPWKIMEDPDTGLSPFTLVNLWVPAKLLKENKHFQIAGHGMGAFAHSSSTFCLYFHPGHSTVHTLQTCLRHVDWNPASGLKKWGFQTWSLWRGKVPREIRPPRKTLSHGNVEANFSGTRKCTLNKITQLIQEPSVLLAWVSCHWDHRAALQDTWVPYHRPAVTQMQVPQHCFSLFGMKSFQK